MFLWSEDFFLLLNLKGNWYQKFKFEIFVTVFDKNHTFACFRNLSTVMAKIFQEHNFKFETMHNNWTLINALCVAKADAWVERIIKSF